MRAAKLLFLAVSIVLGTDYFSLFNVRRIEKDLYRDYNSNLYIETRVCSYFAMGEEAILKYEGPGESSGTVIIWHDKSTCDVKRVFKKN
jgi:hypothetical protein